MFTERDDMEATALRKRGWSISAIARHLGRDRKTVRAYLSGERQAGVRQRSEPDPFVELVPYLRARFDDDKHLWASALYDARSGGKRPPNPVESGHPIRWKAATQSG